MKVVLALFFVLILFGGLVMAADSWDEFSDEGSNVADISDGGNSNLGEESDSDNLISSDKDSSTSSVSSTKYTNEFKIALGVGVGGVIIIIFLFFLLLRHSKNHWKERK